jgi:hypothetical protein
MALRLLTEGVQIGMFCFVARWNVELKVVLGYHVVLGYTYFSYANLSPYTQPYPPFSSISLQIPRLASFVLLTASLDFQPGLQKTDYFSPHETCYLGLRTTEACVAAEPTRTSITLKSRETA